MRTCKYILYYWLVFLLCTSCQNESDDNNKSPQSGATKLSYCDSIYNAFFQNDPRLLKMEDVAYSNLESLNQLIKISDSDTAQGYFILHFDSDSMRQSLPLRSRFLYDDKERRQKNPKVGTYLTENYEFQFLENQEKIRIYSSIHDFQTIDESRLLDTVKSIVFNDFMADSSIVTEFSYIMFKYPTPIDLQDYKDLAIFINSLTAELLDTLCDRYDENDPLLKFRVEKLAYSTFKVWYDWTDSFDYATEIMHETPKSNSQNIDR